MNGNKNDLDDLKQALAELDQRLEQIKISDAIKATELQSCCPYCFNALMVNDFGQVMDYCTECDTELIFYYQVNLNTSCVELVTNDFY